VSTRAAATSPAAAQGSTHGRKPLRLRPRAAVLLFAMFMVGMLAIAPSRAYLDQRAVLHQLEQQAAQLEQQNRDLEQRVADLNDPRTLERLARECLGMVMPGEIGFVTIPKGQAPVPPDCG